MLRGTAVKGWIAIITGFMAVPAAAQQIASVADLSRLSIDDLANLQITSVSRQAEPISGAPAAVYVITNEDIRRSGARSIPEMLRLAPNLQVMQTSTSDYVISSHGFSGNSAAQNFPDKLLVLIDGRSVYSPLYSGVYWDMQDVPAENIERIEVISGPGATLWGANAVNGVINIITKKAADTQGALVEIGGGNLQQSALLQYGGTFGDNGAYRLYLKDFYNNALDNAAGTNAHTGWTKPQAGFRVDWGTQNDAFTVQGDLFAGSENQATTPQQLIQGANLQANWQRQLENGSSLQILTYYDQVRRSTENGGGAFVLDTYDVELQHNFNIEDWNKIVWGAGYRFSQYHITSRLSPSTSLIFAPDKRNLTLANAFVQDDVSLTESLQLILGLKVEKDPYSEISPMPSVRASWKASDDFMVWGAISRAVRSPTPFDRDVVEKLATVTFLSGNPDFRPEELTAYEIGIRGQISDTMSFSLSGYDNVYDRLKSIELGPVGGPFLQWGNMMKGRVYGIEGWGNYQVDTWWRLTAGFNLQHESLEFEPGASGLLGVAQAGDDPHYQASLRSSMDLTDDIVLDATLRYVGKLPDPYLPAYAELNTRLNWHATPSLDISLSGFNLLHAQHQELPGADKIPRSFFLETQFRF